MKKGFTLMELLAVIILLAVITLITVPMIFAYINDSKQKAFESGIQNVFDAVNTYISSNENFKQISITDPKLNLKNENYTSGIIYLNSEGTLTAENISDGKFCASGEKSDLSVTNANDTSLPCSGLDNTPPDLELYLNSKLTTSLTIVADASDRQSAILGYSYSLNNKDWSKIDSSQLITVKGLTKNQEVTVYVKAYNINYDGTNEETTSTVKQIVANTSSTENIDFEVTTNESNTVKVVNIIYPIGDNYKYYYAIKTTGELNYIETTNEITAVVVKENCTLIGKVIYADNTYIENSLEINGIDKVGPSAKVSFTSNYEKAKKITVDVLEEQTGLQSKTYSFDGGKTWQIDNFKIYGENITLTDKIVVRDKLGNTNKKLIYCIDGVCGTETNTININHIDSTLPTAVWTYTTGSAKVVCSDTESGISASTPGATYVINGASDITKKYTCTDNAGNSLVTSKSFIYNSCLTGGIACQAGYDYYSYQEDYSYSCNCGSYCTSGCGRCYGVSQVYGCELDGGHWAAGSCDTCHGTRTVTGQTYNACKTSVNTCIAGFTMK